MGWDPVARRFFIAGYLCAIPFVIALFFVEGEPARWITLGAICPPLLGLSVALLVTWRRRRTRVHR